MIGMFNISLFIVDFEAGLLYDFFLICHFLTKIINVFFLILINYA